MSHFYGSITGQTGTATRCGSRRSGYHAWAQNGTGRIVVDLLHSDGRDFARLRVDGSTISYGGETLDLGIVDLSALAEHSGNPGVRSRIDKARRKLEAASAKAERLAGLSPSECLARPVAGIRPT